MALHTGTGRGPGHQNRLSQGAGSAALTSTKRVLMIGDSTMAGRGAGTGANFMDGARLLSMPTRAAVGLAALGFPATYQDSIGEANNTFAALPAYDARIAITNTAPVAATEGPSIGGSIARFGTTTLLDFTPDQNVDTCEIYDNTLAGYGTMRLTVAGAAASPDMVLTLPGNAFKKFVYTFTKGKPQLRLSVVSGLVRRAAMVCYDSTAPQFIIMNAGTREWETAKFVDAAGHANPASPFNVLSTYVGAGDLIIINLGINDNRLGVTAQVYSDNMQALITQYLTTGAQVILQIPTPNSGDGSGVTQAQIASTIASLTTSNSLPAYIDSRIYTGTWAAMLAAGETVDSFHITAAPYQRVVTGGLIPAIRTWAGV